MTPRRVQKFTAFLQETAITDFASWERYCKTIARSRFLKGENASGFRATLDWALKPENAQKILGGICFLKRHCEENDYSDSWFRACLDLAHRLGQATFENWFRGIVPQEGFETLTLETGSTFIRDYINTHYENELEKVIRTVFPHQTRIQMRVTGPPPETLQALPPPTRQSGRHRDLKRYAQVTQTSRMPPERHCLMSNGI